MPVDELQLNNAQTPEILNGEPLPPVPDGCVRLYRGDAVDENRKPIIQVVEGRSTAEETAGRWFTDDPNAAEGYGGGRQHDHDNSHIRLRFVDVPEDIAKKYNTRELPSEVMTAANGTGGLPEEWLLPAEVADSAQEYRVEDTDRLYDSDTESSLREFLETPEITDYLGRMNYDPANLEDIVMNPSECLHILGQASMAIGQGHLQVANIDGMKQAIRELSVGIEGAHKVRLLGQHVTKKPEPKPLQHIEMSDDW